MYTYIHTYKHTHADYRTNEDILQASESRHNREISTV